MLPEVDAGIFLDTDLLLLDDVSVLWDQFHLFTPFTAMALAPVEPHYSLRQVGPGACREDPTCMHACRLCHISGHLAWGLMLGLLSLT
jgi:hypothetical protein